MFPLLKTRFGAAPIPRRIILTLPKFQWMLMMKMLSQTIKKNNQVQTQILDRWQLEKMLQGKGYVIGLITA